MSETTNHHVAFLMDLAPGSVALAGIVGSTAYGLNTAESDEDLLGVYQADPAAILGLHAQDLTSNTATAKGPDTALHELGKFASLALRSNPTVTELLWLPSYLVRDETGNALVEARAAFLSTGSVRFAYLGYATSQASKLQLQLRSADRDETPAFVNRLTKHIRHSFRLLDAGRQLLTTGELNVDVSAQRDRLFELGELARTAPDRVLEIFEAERVEVGSLDSVLADKPDVERIEQLVRGSRLRLLANT